MESIELTTANSGAYIAPRRIPRSMGVAGVYMYLRARLDAERAARGNPAYPVKVRAWRVTDAGTYIYPPIAELSA